MPKPLRKPASVTTRDETLIAGEKSEKRTQAEIASGPALPALTPLIETVSAQAMPRLSGDKVGGTFDGWPLPTFINTVFGDLLKVTFEVHPMVAQRDLLVTLRTSETMDRNEFLSVVIQTLRNYDVGVVYQNGVYRIIDATSIKQDVPRIIRSRSLPNVPADARPTFMFVQLHSVQSAYMLMWLEMAFKDRLRFQGINQVNGVLLIGTNDDIRAAMQTIEVLDQPSMAGSRSIRIAPAHWTARALADQLAIVLTAEGYSAGVGSDGTLAIKLVPIPALNILIVFTPSEKNIQHVVEWIGQLDRPGQTVNARNTFYYQVQNTSAKTLAETLSRVLTGVDAAPALATAQPTGAIISGPGAAAQQNTPAPPLSAALSRQVTVDAARNAIIFQGMWEEWSQFQKLAAFMDRAPLEVLIEATIAEVTLTEGETLGMVLDYNDARTLTSISSAVKSDAGLLVNLVRDRGRLLANLTASANKNKVSILSSPRVVASSGKTAQIQVGTKVPILTSQQTASAQIGGNSALIQQVQYQDTGVILKIDPTINSNHRVELDIQQEVSEAQTNSISTVQSPTIFTRTINTSLSLRDGETVLLGGLISENVSRGNNGIPVLKDVPLLGNLFRRSSTGRTRIELIVLLTPYIIDSADTSNAVRDSFVEQLTQLPPVPVANGGEP